MMKMNSRCWKYILGILIILCSTVSFAQNDSLGAAKTPHYSFVNEELNVIQTVDSNYLYPIYQELYEYSKSKTGKIKILQIGDSHVQAGFWGAKFRERLHYGFDQGTIERGFIFPYKMAKTNGPVNYGVQFEGEWEGCRNVFTEKRCGWGVSGITATTYTGGKLKLWFDNKTFKGHMHDRVDVYFVDSLKNYTVNLETATDIIAIDTLVKANALRFYLGEVTDTFWLSFTPKQPIVSPFILQGLYFGNQLDGITFSEIGVNGAEVPSYLACPLFNDQLKAIDPDLIFLSLGTNDVYSETYNDSIFYHQYDSLITNILTVNPRVKIILTTPGDCKRYRKYTIKETQTARATINRLALKHHIAVWDFNEVMGGLYAMDKWYSNGLTSRDKLHLNAKGYELQGMLMYDALMRGYQPYAKNLDALSDNNDEKDEGGLLDLFFFNPNEPFIFTSYMFWIFFTVFMGVYSLIYKNIPWRNAFLVLFSFFFYYKAGGFYFFLLIFSTIVDYYLGNFIYQSATKTRRKLGVFLSVFINLSVLVYYKYAYFIVNSLNGLLDTEWVVHDYLAILSNQMMSTELDTTGILLPVGISFYTFQTISYSVDIYRNRIQPVKNIFDFAFYVSFFPQLVAGPIVRANEFVAQIYQPYQLTTKDFGRAFFLIVAGLFKKIVISDYLSANLVDRVFADPTAYSGFENLLGIYGYAFQIFCDFSGYTDIAIGIALLLGFQLPLNFNKPYLSVNITEFWRRWHISLSSWLKDYLYIPLGGNRKGTVRMYINLMITMLLGGLWHGASWNFVIWGALHGLALVVHKLYITSVAKQEGGQVVNFFSMIFTFHFVCLCWVFFRAETFHQVNLMLSQVIHSFQTIPLLDVIVGHHWVISIMILALILHCIPDRLEWKVQDLYAKINWMALAGVAMLFTIVLYQFKSAEIQPFIYFQF